MREVCFLVSDDADRGTGRLKAVRTGCGGGRRS